MDELHNGSTVQEFIQQQLCSARLDLVCFPFQSLLKKLKENPDGVSQMDFLRVLYEGKALHGSRAIGKVIINRRASPVVFRMDRPKYRQYTLMTRAHRTALADYAPREQ